MARIASTAASGSPAAITSVRMRWVMACATSSSGESVWIVARRKLLIRPRMSWRPRSGSSGRPAAKAARGSDGRGRGRPRRRRGGRRPPSGRHTRRRSRSTRGVHRSVTRRTTNPSSSTRMLEISAMRDRRELGDPGAAAWQAHDEPLVLELRERLAHGDVAHAEVSRERPLDEPIARGVLARVWIASRRRSATASARLWSGRGWSGDGIELPDADGIRSVTERRRRSPL